MKEEFSYSAEQPQMVKNIGLPSNPLFQVCFDTELIESTGPDGKVSTQYRSHYVHVDRIEYSTLVSAIVSSRYTSNDVEAIMLNNMEASNPSLSVEKKLEYINEYNNLQAWRTHAKEIALEAIL